MVHNFDPKQFENKNYRSILQMFKSFGNENVTTTKLIRNCKPSDEISVSVKLTM